MRLPETAMRWLAAISVAVAGLLSTNFAAAEEVLTLRDAELRVSIANETMIRAIQLPLDWDLDFRGLDGRAQLRLTFPYPPYETSASEPSMLFLRSVGNAYEIELNGSLLALSGSLDRRGERWSAKQPVGIYFPSSLLREQNELIVRLRADAGRRAGLAPIALGPASVVEPLRARAHRLRVVPTFAASLFALLVSAFCWVLWLQHRDRLFASAAIAEALWAVIVFDVILEWVPLPWPAWGYAIPVLLALWMCALVAIVEQVFPSRPRYEGLSIRVIAAAIAPCIVVAEVTQSPAALEVWRGLSATAVAVVAVRLSLTLRTQFSVERALLTAGILGLYLAALYDAFASRLRDMPFSDSYWGEYAGTFLGLTIMWAVSKRFQQARADAEALRASLARRIAEKEDDLRKSFERLARVERSQAALAERERILRDMHDGVGAKLSSVVRKLESGQSRREEVAVTLRESLDRLKLSIDAMSLPAGDVNALLASLRYRLQARIANAGVELEWEVGELPPWRGGTDSAMRRLQFLLLDAIVGILESPVTVLCLSAHLKDGAIELQIADDAQDDRLAFRAGALQDHAIAIDAQLRLATLASADRSLIVRLRLRLATVSGS